MALDNYLEFGLRVLTVLSLAFNVILLFVNRRKAKKAQDTYTAEVDKAVQNKAAQKDAEKELDMAEFLCDRCGKKAKVKDSQTLTIEGNELDLCRDCAEWFKAQEQKMHDARVRVESLEAKVKQLQEQLSSTQNALAAAQQELLAVSLEVQPKAADTEAPAESQSASGADSDILKKLGV